VAIASCGDGFFAPSRNATDGQTGHDYFCSYDLPARARRQPFAALPLALYYVR